MTCQACKDAGALLAAGRWFPEGSPDRRRASVLVVQLHEACEAPSTCACQHRVNLEAVKM